MVNHSVTRWTDRFEFRVQFLPCFSLHPLDCFLRSPRMFCSLLLINYHFNDMDSKKSSWINLFPITSKFLWCWIPSDRERYKSRFHQRPMHIVATSGMQISAFSSIVMTSSHLSEVLLIAVHHERVFRLNLGVITLQIYSERSGSVRDMWTLRITETADGMGKRGPHYWAHCRTSSFSIMRTGMRASSLEIDVRYVVNFTNKHFHLYHEPAILPSTPIFLDLTAY